MSYRSAYTSRAFWLETADRAVKTAAQFILLGLGLSDAGPVNAFDVSWELAVGFALGGAVLSALTSIISAGTGTPGNASVFSIPGSTPPEDGI